MDKTVTLKRIAGLNPASSASIIFACSGRKGLYEIICINLVEKSTLFEGYTVIDGSKNRLLKSSYGRFESCTLTILQSQRLKRKRGTYFNTIIFLILPLLVRRIPANYFNNI